jgi:hypothetical protein
LLAAIPPAGAAWLATSSSQASATGASTPDAVIGYPHKQGGRGRHGHRPVGLGDGRFVADRDDDDAGHRRDVRVGRGGAADAGGVAGGADGLGAEMGGAVITEINEKFLLVAPAGPAAEFLLDIDGDRAWFRWIDAPAG